MKRTPDTRLGAADLRRRAEKRLEEKRKSQRAKVEDRMPAVEMERLFNELKVHQIELEIQNEELTRARAELEAGLEQYADLYDFAPVGYFTLDRAGMIRRVNLTGARLLGVESARLVGRPFSFFISTVDHPVFNVFLEKVFADKGKETCDVSLRNKDNEPLWVRIDATANEDGQECRVTLVDITARKRAEEEILRRNKIDANQRLQNVEHRQQALLDNIPDIAWLKDKESHFIAVNEAFGRACGFAPETLVGKTDLDIWPEDLAERYRADDREVVETGRQKRVEEPLADKEGQIFWIETIKRPIFDDYGLIVGTTGIARDITDRKKKEAELLNALTKLQETKDMLVQLEKQAAMGRLAAGLAHEILNPVTIISSRLQILESSEHLAGQLRETLRVCRNQIGRIVKITKDLHLSSQTGQPARTSIDLAMIIRRALFVMDSNLKAGKVRCEVLISRDIPFLHADGDKMERMIINMIFNALDSMADNKEKILIVSLRLIGGEQKCKKVCLSIADNGTGIKKEDLPKIFDLFFTTKAPGKGTGLGLSVCHGIVQEHGGRIWVENNEMGGASFFVEIPVEESP